MKGWQPVIGLEVHARLLTRSKLFSGASASYGAAPNTQACAVDLGLPGVLPVLNREAVRMAVRFGLAVGARIAPRCVFARKNYFYPDLPKGYQISQYEDPITAGGAIAIEPADGPLREIGLVRAHLEEDAGRSVHEGFGGLSGIDLNRAGTPLLEIVTEPALHGAAEAAACMRKIHTLVRWLGICDGNMQEGSFRCDANVSVRPAGSGTLGTRAEIKNVNSFRFVERAITYEIERQIDLIESGGEVVQETRLYDPDHHETRPMRDKEEADDYRYFPDPDLLPVAHRRGVRRGGAREPAGAPRCAAGPARGASTGWGPVEAAQLVSHRETADYFEAAVGAVIEAGGSRDAARTAANWVNGELAGALNRDGLRIDEARVDAGRLGRLVRRIADGTVSGRMAKTVFDAMWASGGEPDAIIDARGLRQVTDAGEIERLVDAVLEAHPAQVEQYLGGGREGPRVPRGAGDEALGRQGRPAPGEPDPPRPPRRPPRPSSGRVANAGLRGPLSPRRRPA